MWEQTSLLEMLTYLKVPSVNRVEWLEVSGGVRDVLALRPEVTATGEMRSGI